MSHILDLQDCTLCPRNCHANRAAGQKGYCGQASEIAAARAALHMWEEPCISGQTGSGTVFFSGCNMGCVFCQNHPISKGITGKKVSPQRLEEIFLQLQEQKACNINLVTPTHFIPQIRVGHYAFNLSPAFLLFLRYHPLNLWPAPLPWLLLPGWQ